MKKISFFVGAALLVALYGTGCSKDQIADKEPPGTPGGVAGEGIRTLTVGLSQFDDPQSRASLGAENASVHPVVWDEGDQIIAFETVGEYTVGHLYRLVGQGGTGSGSFEYVGGDTPPASIAEIYYPASLAASGFAIPAAQTYTSDSFDPGAKVMRAGVTDPTEQIVFESLASIVCLRLTGNGEEVTSVRADLTPSAGAKQSYTLTCPEAVVLSDTPTPFYIVVEGSTEGRNADFTVAIDGKETMLQSTTAPKTFAASTVVRMPLLPYSKNLYQVMDYWPSDAAPQGVVFQVSDGGLHGKVLSHQQKEGNWGPLISEKNAGVAYMREEPENGKLVTQQLLALHKDEVDFATNYPDFEWILNTKNGGDINGPWYAPSRTELRQLFFVMCDVNPADYTTWSAGQDNVPLPGYDSDDAKAARNAFKARIDAITNSDGLNLFGRLYSTWENAVGTHIWSLQLNEGQYKVMLKDGGTVCRIRPVRQF